MSRIKSDVNRFRNIVKGRVREELRRHHKAGWSLDDLYSEATFEPGEDDSLKNDEPKELDFDF